MDGMEVKVTFVGGGEATVSWLDGAGAVGSGWSLTLDNYTINSLQANWSLDVSTSGLFINTVTLNGFDYNVVFDNEPFPTVGTVGSNIGQWRVNSASTAGDVLVSFKDGVKLDTDTVPFGDLFQTMTLDFTSIGTGAGFGVNNVYSFRIDTDNLVSPVPEPATILLFGIGAACFAGGRFRKQNRG